MAVGVCLRNCRRSVIRRIREILRLAHVASANVDCWLERSWYYWIILTTTQVAIREETEVTCVTYDSVWIHLCRRLTRCTTLWTPCQIQHTTQHQPTAEQYPLMKKLDTNATVFRDESCFLHPMRARILSFPQKRSILGVHSLPTNVILYNVCLSQYENVAYHGHILSETDVANRCVSH